MRAVWPLVGRDDDLQFVADALAGGRTGGVVLVGPPGVGKSRLASEVTDRTRACGLATASVIATVTTSQIPMGAMAPLLTGAVTTQVDRLRALNRGCAALQSSAGGRRLVLCVDDAHLLDPLSAALVHQAVTMGTVTLLATIRRGAEAPADVTSLWKDGIVDRVEVTGLSRAETGDLVTAVLGGPVHGATVERLWNITEGNVLFLREIIEGAIAAGDLTSRDGIWRIGQSLRPGPALIDLVDLRFGSLTPNQESVIGYIALAEPVDADIVTKVTSSVEVEDAERTGMVTTFDDHGCVRLRLAHPIYGEVVRAGLPPLRRRRMLGDLADVLEARGAERSDAVLALATWKLGSGRECSLAVLLAASRQARHLFDYELAERLAAAAVAMHGGTAASVARAQCLFLWGRFTAADAALASIDLDAATDRERADVTIARATNLMWGSGDHEAAARLLTDATLAVSDSDALDELHALRAGLALCRVRLGDVLALTERVLARSDAGELSSLSAVTTRAPALVFSGRSTEALALLDAHTSVALSRLADFPQGIGTMLTTRTVAHYFAGEFDRAEQIAVEMYETGIAMQSWEAVAAGARSRAWAALARGRPRSAMRWALEAIAAIPDGDLNGSAGGCHSVLAEAAAVAGDPSAAQALAKMNSLRHPSIRVYDGFIALAHAWQAAMAGELSRAVTIIETAAAGARAGGAFAVECHLLHNAVRFGRPERVAGRLVELADLVDGPLGRAFADHAVALHAHDAESLEQIAATFSGVGAMLLAAETEMQAARAHRRHGRERRRRAAATRSAALAAGCEGASTPALTMPEPVVALTRRENEIAALAGHGLSSPEIARRLIVSTRTVEGHLQRLYSKLGVSDRTQLDAHRVG